MARSPRHPIASLALVSLLVATTHAAAAPPGAQPVTINDPRFETPRWGVLPGQPATTPAVCASTPGAVGGSASAGWTTYGNTPHTSISSWLTPAPGGYSSNLVATGGGQGGLVQVLTGQGTVTSVNRVSAWVYVVAGRIAVQIGDGGSGGGQNAVSRNTGAWEYLSACGRADWRNNEITIYGQGPAVFYVHEVTVADDPWCPCAHAPDTTGVALTSSCSACVATVCAADPYCCTTAWDAICAGRASGC